MTTMTTTQEQTNQDLLQAYEEALARHDWNYQFSDCNFTYREGTRTASAIQQAKMKCIKVGLEEQAEEIYKEFMQRRAKAKRY